MAKQMVATETFLAVVNGYTDRISQGEILDADHEAVRNHPDKFERAPKTRPDVEEATAAPGEKRGSRK